MGLAEKFDYTQNYFRVSFLQNQVQQNNFI